MGPRKPEPLPVRRQPIHVEPRERLGVPIIVFVTAAAQPILAHPMANALILSAWRTAEAGWLGVTSFCLITSISSARPGADVLPVGYWKAAVAVDGQDLLIGQYGSGTWDSQLRRDATRLGLC
jgi:hypothetical protein